MSVTPSKSVHNLSLVKSPRSSEGIGQRTQTICNKLLEFHKKWKAAQDRGTSLCNAIEKIKSNLVTNRESVETLFPPNLIDYCKKLAIITTIFEDIVTSTKESLVQLRALQQLSAPEFPVVTKTWTSQDYVQFIEKILLLYEEEYKMKKIVCENIGHSKSKQELVLNSVVWSFPCYANQNLDFLFKFLLIESSWSAPG